MAEDEEVVSAFLEFRSHELEECPDDDDDPQFVLVKNTPSMGSLRYCVYKSRQDTWGQFPLWVSKDGNEWYSLEEYPGTVLSYRQQATRVDVQYFREKPRLPDVAVFNCNRSVNAHIAAALCDMRAATTHETVATEIAFRGNAGADCTITTYAELRFTSATTLVLGRDHRLTAAKIAALFCDARLYGFSRLELSNPKLAAEVIALKPPCLRQVFVSQMDSSDVPPKPVFVAVGAAAAASPYLEEVEVEWDNTAALMSALAVHLYRPREDPHTSVKLTFNDETTEQLRRRVPLVPLSECFVPAEKPGKDAGSIVIRLLGKDSPPLRRDRLCFAPVLQELFAASGRKDRGVPDADAVTGGAIGDVVTLPSTYRNSDGEEELENRFSNVDVALAVRWLNEYACKEVHDMVKKRPATYFISLHASTFLQQKGKRRIDQLSHLHRCLSLLALAHFLGIATLQNYLTSFLASPAAALLQREEEKRRKK